MEKFEIARSFARVRTSSRGMPMLKSILQIARVSGMDEAIETTRDFDEFGLGFYMRIYLRLHREEITYVPGSEVARQVDINDRLAIKQKIDGLIKLKNLAVKEQAYEAAVAYRNMEKWLHIRLIELDRDKVNRNKATI